MNDICPVNETFLIDNSTGSGVSSHQFQILSGRNVLTYYYYPDSNTIRGKESFDRILRKLIQGKCCLIQFVTLLTDNFHF